MEVDEPIELTAKVFQSGIKSSHTITLSDVSSSVHQLQQLISKKLELPSTKHSIGLYIIRVDL